MERINLSKYSWTWGILFLELHWGRKGWMVKEGFLEELMFELIPKWDVQYTWKRGIRKTEYLSKIHHVLGGTTAFVFSIHGEHRKGMGRSNYGHIIRATSQSALQRNVAFTLKAIGVIEKLWAVKCYDIWLWGRQWISGWCQGD